MKKLTDEMVAKALGWYAGRVKGQWWKWQRPKDHMPLHAHELPPFTTSLDAIVGEIEARELNYCIMAPGKGSLNWKPKIFNASVGNSILFPASTAPLALCAALLAYLKVTP